MISLEDARARILGALAPLPPEPLPLIAAVGRFAAEDVHALHAAPPFDNSAFDGYAVRAADLMSARPGLPLRLPVIGTSAAGSTPGETLEVGTCRRIFTGAPLPPGADAVLMQEEASLQPGSPPQLTTETPVRPWEGVRFAGEDFRAGELVVPLGTRLAPTHLALLAAAGHGQVRVPRPPRVILLSTGNELVDPGMPLEPGRIPDSNGVLIETLVAETGAELVRRQRVEDRLEPTLEALKAAARDADVVVSTGGVSVGDADLLRPALEQLGGTLGFWRISMKPGKPFAFGRLGKAWWLGLPGNPVSAFVTWWQLVRPALYRLAGAGDTPRLTAPGHLGQPFANRGDRRHFVRVCLDSDGRITAPGPQGSHRLSSLAQANALLDMPPETSWPEGREVIVECIDAAGEGTRPRPRNSPGDGPFPTAG